MKALTQFTERFGSMMSGVLLTVLYFGVLGPVALIYQLFCDPLRLKKPRNGSNWTPWRESNHTVAAARRQD